MLLSHTLSLRFKDFFPLYSLNSTFSSSPNQNVQPSEPILIHWTVSSRNERFVVIFIIVSNGSFSPPPGNGGFLAVCLLWSGWGRQGENKKVESGEWRWIKLFVLSVLGHTVCVFVCPWGAAQRSRHWQTHRCGCCQHAELPSLNREIILDLQGLTGKRRRLETQLGWIEILTQSITHWLLMKFVAFINKICLLKHVD